MGLIIFEAGIISRKQSYISLLVNFSINDLHYVFNNAKGTTPSLDRTIYTMIKNTPIAFKNRLIKLYNNVLDSGIYPHDWKLSLLTPIPKPGKNPNKIEDYRPISLIHVLSKVLEKLIVFRFWKHEI